VAFRTMQEAEPRMYKGLPGCLVSTEFTTRPQPKRHKSMTGLSSISGTMSLGWIRVLTRWRQAWSQYSWGLAHHPGKQKRKVKHCETYKYGFVICSEVRGESRSCILMPSFLLSWMVNPPCTVHHFMTLAVTSAILSGLWSGQTR
jgi:hypothetical protein